MRAWRDSRAVHFHVQAYRFFELPVLAQEPNETSPGERRIRPSCNLEPLEDSLDIVDDISREVFGEVKSLVDQAVCKMVMAIHN